VENPTYTFIYVYGIAVAITAKRQEAGVRRKKKEISPLPLCEPSTITYLGVAEKVVCEGR
jgi:hypothetical protein